MSKNYLLTNSDSIWKCTFNAMASPCEILFSTDSVFDAKKYADFSYTETKRIESKFSRYHATNIIHKINSSNGFKIKVDDETGRMLDFANQCYHLSGGIGKEYAVDRVAEFASSYQISKVMVNFGGDIRTIHSNLDSPPWVIGIENPQKDDTAIGKISMHNGGIATSGDSKRYCLHNGIRHGHILNPITGWPIENAPRAVSVVSENCTQAGIIATMAMLQGKNAEQFLESQDITYKCFRD